MPCVKSYGAYSLPLGVASHHHRELLSSESHVMPRQDRHQPDLQQDTERSLRFSIVNILKSDFGRDAIRNTKVPNETAVSAANPAQHPRRSPLPLPRDLSVSSTRLSSPQSTSEGHWINYPIREKDLSPLCGIASPLQKHSNGLSRSGSLESLASNRSSATNSSVTSPPSLSSTISGDSLNGENTSGSTSTSQQNSTNNNQSLWPAWVYCTRYSDRPSSGPRTRRMKRPQSSKNSSPEEKRPRTAFSAEQLSRLKREFTENRYLMERRRQELSRELNLNEAQIKIWFQNKRAKLKKASGQKNPLAIQLMAQGLYNHSTVPIDDDDEEIVNERNH